MSKFLTIFSLVLLLVTVGCMRPPAGEYAPFGFSLEEIERGAELIPPEYQQSLRKELKAAQVAVGSNRSEDAISHLNAVSGILGDLPETESAIALQMDLATALDRDLLVLELAKGKEVWGAGGDKMWNMKCVHDGPNPGGDGFINMRCEVERGRWCKLIIYKGKIVGCLNGKM